MARQLALSRVHLLMRVPLLRGRWLPMSSACRYPRVDPREPRLTATHAATHAKADGIRRVLTEPDGLW